MNWSEFETAAPQLAARGRERLEQTNVALLGTVRADGSPRISPIEPYFAAGQLLFGVMRSAKSGDLERDVRCTVHSSVSRPDGSEGEFKLFGRAVLVTDPELRSSEPRAWWRSYPAQAADVYWLDIGTAAFVAWDFNASRFDVSSWSESAGVRRRTARYP